MSVGRRAARPIALPALLALPAILATAGPNGQWVRRPERRVLGSMLQAVHAPGGADPWRVAARGAREDACARTQMQSAGASAGAMRGGRGRVQL